MFQERHPAAPIKLTRILCIDGGGVMLIRPGMVLVELERMLKQLSGNPDACIADYFDLVAGTSSGSIMACALVTPDTTGRPRYSARQTVDFYLQRSGEIFSTHLWRRWKWIRGMFDERYNTQPMDAMLEEYFTETRLSELLKPCVIPTYDLHQREAQLFSPQGINQDNPDFLVRDLCRASSAAPTLFEPARIRALQRDKAQYLHLIDGGVFANNPAMCAYAEARASDFRSSGRALKPTASQMAVLSLGVGRPREPIPYEKARNWGFRGWARPLLDILLTAGTQAVDVQLARIFEATGFTGRYLRIDPEFQDVDYAMDNARPENLQALCDQGRETATDPKVQADLHRFAEMLVENA